MSVMQALAAMDAAVTEAMTILGWKTDRPVEHRWAADRLRLVTRDRVALERHKSSTDHGKYDPYCVSCWEESGMDGAPTWPCPDARAVIDYWTAS